MGPTASSPLWTLTWSAYADSPPVQLPLSALKPIPIGQKRKLEEAKKEEAEKEKKKAKNEKWKEVKKSKNEEAVAKQQSWQKFGVKAKKKGIAIAGLTGESIFRSPDNPHGRGQSIVFRMWQECWCDRGLETSVVVLIDDKRN